MVREKLLPGEGENRERPFNIASRGGRERGRGEENRMKEAARERCEVAAAEL